MNSPYIRLYSGIKFHVLNPKPSEIDIADITHALSHLCRFTGHTKKFYSVGQHSCLVSDILPNQYKMTGLLHDASEAFANDIAKPLKECIPQYKEIEFRIERVIAKKFGLQFPMPAIIKEADMRLLVTEMRDLMIGCDWKNLTFAPLDSKITPWGPDKTRREFLNRYNQYLEL